VAATHRRQMDGEAVLLSRPRGHVFLCRR
jgi:hypothetical protein